MLLLYLVGICIDSYHFWFSFRYIDHINLGLGKSQQQIYTYFGMYILKIERAELLFYLHYYFLNI